MNKFDNFEVMVEFLRHREGKKSVAVAWGSDESTLTAVSLALQSGFIKAVFVGCEDIVRADGRFAPFAEDVSFVDAATPDDAASHCVALAREGKVDILMKGMINTDNLLRAVINKETGILPKGTVMTHIAVAETPLYHKILFFTDAAAIPFPTPEQREAQIEYLADIIRRTGIEVPRIGLVHCSEKVSEKHFPYTADYVAKKEEAAAGKFGKCIVDGPLDLKCCCSLHALEAKGLHSALEGDADAVVFPNIEAANAFYKTMTLFGGAQIAGILKGAKVPVVLPSRGDTPESKYYSLAVASI